MEPSKVGGKTLLSSTVHVYNEIARTKPYLIDVLSREDWPHYTYVKTDYPSAQSGTDSSLKGSTADIKEKPSFTLLE